MSTVVESRVAPLRPVSGAEDWKRELSRLKDTLASIPPTRSRAKHRRVLIPMLVGSSDLFAIREGLIAHALRLRGADVIFVLCDGLHACDARTYDTDDPEQCSRCFPEGVDNLTRFGHSVLPLSAFVTRARAEALRARAQDHSAAQILSASHAGIDLGRHVFTSTLRYFRRAELDLEDPEVLARARMYLGSALVMTEAARNVYLSLEPHKVFSSHGMYATWGPWSALARAMDIRCDIYGGGWRKNTLLCQHDADRFAHADDVWDLYRDQPLTQSEESALTRYLDSRETNRNDAFRYFDAVDRDAPSWLARLAGDGSWRTRACLFSNVGWDAARFRQEGVFGDMFIWIVETVRYYRAHPEHLLLVKVHPAESRFREATPSDGTVPSVLERELGELPPNVRIVPGDDNISNHALGALLDLSLVHTSSVGFELALLGRPVLTTGASVHYEKPGLVSAPRDREDYFSTLARLVEGEPLERPNETLARRYAYTIYFRKSLPFELIDVEGWSPRAIAIESLADLAPGRFRGLDVLCDGILEDAPLALP